MECAVAFRQLSFTGDTDPKMNELYGLPEKTLSGLLNETGKNTTIIRTESSLSSDYIEPFRLIGGFLPDDDAEALKIFHIITDLALMSPIGRFNSLATYPSSFADLLPNMRLVKAADAVSRLGIRVTDINEDYTKTVDAICIDEKIRWPEPDWIAIKTPRLSGNRESSSCKALFDLQQYAANYRRQHPGLFAFPMAPLIDDMRIPTVIYTDGQRGGVPMEIQGELAFRYFRKLCAETWILGRKVFLSQPAGFRRDL